MISGNTPFPRILSSKKTNQTKTNKQTYSKKMDQDGKLSKCIHVIMQGKFTA